MCHIVTWVVSLAVQLLLSSCFGSDIEIKLTRLCLVFGFCVTLVHNVMSSYVSNKVNAEAQLKTLARFCMNHSVVYKLILPHVVFI